MTDPLAELDEFVDMLELEEEERVLKDLDDLVPDSYIPPPAKKAKKKKAQPAVKWATRDADGNIIRARPGRTSANQAGPSQKVVSGQKTVPPSVPDINFEVSYSPDDVESFIQELQLSLGEEEPTTSAPLRASTDWSTRKRLMAERFRAERPRLVDSAAAKENTAAHVCQQCGMSPAVVRCHDCQPQPFMCADCDATTHSRYVLHNRDAMINGFFQPLSPTTCIVDKATCHCERLVPVQTPDVICGCPKEALRLKPGKEVIVITMDGRYDLNMPHLSCDACNATWTAGIDELIKTNYWPATLQFETVYATDVFQSFQDMKMASPGLSCQAFIKMLDQRTVHFGRTGGIVRDGFQRCFFEWAAVEYELEKLCKEEPFKCTACSPDMVALSVDGNRKHYRFKNAARSEEQAIFEGDFIAKDEDVTRFVEYIHQKTKHHSGKGVCGGQWSAARETSRKSTSHIDEEGLELAVCRHGVLLSALNMYRGEIYAYPLYLQQKLASSHIAFFCMDVTCKYWPYLQKVSQTCPELKHLLNMKPFLSVFHAKAHDYKCEVKWSGRNQDGAGQTLGEEVEQCNSFLSRIAVTTKHMSKAGRNDMLTLMAMNWNKQKSDNFATALARRYEKTTKDLQTHVKDLELIKNQFAVTESQLDEWVQDVKEWAEAPTPLGPGDLEGTIEMLVVSLRTRNQRLYKDNASNKGRARIRHKIRAEKAMLADVVEQYNSMAPSKDKLSMETILSVEEPWPWHQQNTDTVDLKIKRKAFDTVMAVKRHQEEKKILVKEMKQHWNYISSRVDDLKKLSSFFRSEATEESSWGLSEDGLKGLQSIIQRKLWKIRELMSHSRECYVKALSGAEGVSFLEYCSDEEEYCMDLSGDEL